MGAQRYGYGKQGIRAKAGQLTWRVTGRIALFAADSNGETGRVAGSNGQEGTAGANGSNGVAGAAGSNGATGPAGVGATGPTGPAGSSGTGGHVVTWYGKPKVTSGVGECIEEVSTFANGGRGAEACTPKVEANGFVSHGVKDLEGLVPSGGGTVEDLEAVFKGAPGGTSTYVVEVVNNSTGLTLLTCTATGATAFCQNNTGSASVAAGDYLEVREGGASTSTEMKEWRVTFRY